jgi:hypothetical protein
VVVHVTVGENKRLDFVEIDPERPRVPERSVRRKAEVEEHRALSSFCGEAHHGREPVLGQDAHPVSGLVG